MRHRLLKAVGFSLVAIVLAGIGLSVLLALMQGKPNVGTNHYGLPIGAYSSAAVMVVVVVVLVILGASRVIRELKQRASK